MSFRGQSHNHEPEKKSFSTEPIIDETYSLKYAIPNTNKRCNFLRSRQWTAHPTFHIKAIGAAVNGFGRASRDILFHAGGRGRRIRRIRLAGSLTVEAALALPVCLGILLLLTGLFRALSVYESVDHQLCMAVRKAAAYSAAEDGLSRAEAVRLFLESGAQGGIDTKYIKGGMAGILVSLPEDGSENGMIRMNARYRIRLPGFVLGKRSLAMQDSVCSRVWTGLALGEDGKGGAEGDGGGPVIVADNGVVYHTDENCTYLKLSIRGVDRNKVSSLKNIYGSHYSPCEKCGNVGASGTVYITSDGEAWHSDKSCSGLKRTTRTMTRSQAHDDGLRPCPRCGGKE